VGARQERQANTISVFLQHSLCDLFRGLMQAGVDDFETVIPEGSGNGLGTAVVTIESGLGDDDAIGAFHEHQTLRNTHHFPQPGHTDTRHVLHGASHCGIAATSRQTERVVAIPKVPELRSPVARAVAPVAAGIVFIGLLALVTWGVAAFLANSDTEPTENLAPARLELGSVNGRANDVEEDGPLLFAELSTITGARSLVLDHEGDDPANGWRLYYAYPPGRPDCPVTQVRGTATFLDCEGNELDVTELAPPTDPVRPVVEDERTLYLDLRAFSSSPATTDG
jgi:hypothetical protein